MIEPNAARYKVSVRGLLVTSNVVPSSSILVTLMMEMLSSSETSVLTKAMLEEINWLRSIE
jgi:hypothetical protein